MPNRSTIIRLQNKLKKEAIIKEVNNYLKLTENKFSVIQPEYGGRLALKQASEAFITGNYAVGAALLVYKPKSVEIFLGKNKIVTGTPSERFNTHAETDAIKKWVRSLEFGSKPFHIANQKNEFLGIKIYSNLEPCPKCEMEITMLLALAKEYIHPNALIQSISLAADGILTRQNKTSFASASAHALGKKHFTSPLVWRSIQRGFFPGQKPPKKQPVQFFLLSNSKSALKAQVQTDSLIDSSENELIRLSWEVFEKTRAMIDQFLITGKI
jgi:tRNA(Arg) A34 adenosine deaminase TadA